MLELSEGHGPPIIQSSIPAALVACEGGREVERYCRQGGIYLAPTFEAWRLGDG